MIIPFFKNSFISIDIGFRNIKVVEVSVGKNNVLVIDNYGIAPTPRNSIKNGAIKDVESVTKEIRRVLNDSGMKAKKAKIVMSGTNIISRIIMVDIAPGQEMHMRIKDAIAQNIPINTEEYQIDYKILTEFKIDSLKRAKVFITAVRKNIIKSYVEILKALDLKPISIDIPANSTAKFFNRDIEVQSSELWYKKYKYGNEDQTTFAVLDFGSETTIVNILKDRILEFNKVILIGSTNLDDAIAADLKKRQDEAEALKKIYGILPPTSNASPEQRNVYEPAKLVVERLVKQISHCFEYYEQRCYGAKVGKIFMIGGGSQLKGLREYLEDTLRVPVYPVGLLNIEGVQINKKLDGDKINYLINSVGIAL